MFQMLKIAQLLELLLNNGRLMQSAPYLHRVLEDLAKFLLFGVFAIILFVSLMGFGFAYIYLLLIKSGASISLAIAAIIIPLFLLLVIAILVMRNIWLDTVASVTRIFSQRAPIGDRIQDIAQSFLSGLFTSRRR